MPRSKFSEVDIFETLLKNMFSKDFLEMNGLIFLEIISEKKFLLQILSQKYAFCCYQFVRLLGNHRS